MSLPPIPPPLEHLGSRHFSFYPPILNVEHNEWIYRRTTWSELLVVNGRSGEEIWIPRRFLGEVSRVEDPVVIVGLTKELEYKGGAVWPHQRRVIVMPMAVGENARPPEPAPERAPAPVVGIRLESSPEARVGRMAAAAIAIGVLSCVVILNIVREGQFRPRITYTSHDQSYFQLNRDDDYYAVVRKVGEPSSDHWRSDAGELQYRALAYPAHGFTVILMGTSRDEARYIGAVDEKWNPLHVVGYNKGGSSAALLRNLRKF